MNGRQFRINEKSRRRLSALESPWNREAITPILKGWLHTLPSAADAVYHDALECPEYAQRGAADGICADLDLTQARCQAMREVPQKIVKFEDAIRNCRRMLPGRPTVTV